MLRHPTGLRLDTALDIVENLAFMQVLRSRSPETLLPLVAATFSFRSATPVPGLVAGAAPHASARRART